MNLVLSPIVDRWKESEKGVEEDSMGLKRNKEFEWIWIEKTFIAVLLFAQLYVVVSNCTINTRL